MRKSDKRFEKFIENVRSGDISEVKKYILHYCNTSTSCYYKWISGASTPSKERREIINTIAQQFGYDKVYVLNKFHKKLPVLS